MDAEQLFEMTHRLTETSDRDSLCDVAVDVATQLFDRPLNLLYVYDRYRHRLTATATTTAVYDVLLIEIADNGPGLPAAELAPVEEGIETMLKHGHGVGLWIIDRVLAYSQTDIEYLVDGGGTTAQLRM